MPTFDVEVLETRHYSVTFRVEADSPEQAAAMAEEGTYDSEHNRKLESIGERSVSLDTIKKVPLYVQVEYDLNYHNDGDYNGVGRFAYLLFDDELTDENLGQRFQDQTGYGPEHIIHYTFDELYTKDGDPVGGW